MLYETVYSEWEFMRVAAHNAQLYFIKTSEMLIINCGELPVVLYSPLIRTNNGSVILNVRDQLTIRGTIDKIECHLQDNSINAAKRNDAGEIKLRYLIKVSYKAYRSITEPFEVSMQ